MTLDSGERMLDLEVEAVSKLSVSRMSALVAMEMLVLRRLPVARLLLLPPYVTFLTLGVGLLLVLWQSSFMLLPFRLLRLLA
jgi:hypothetical protein